MKVEVQTPFPFCEKCIFRELEERRIYAQNKLQESFFYCVNQHKCKNVLVLAQRERYAQWLDGRSFAGSSVRRLNRCDTRTGSYGSGAKKRQFACRT